MHGIFNNVHLRKITSLKIKEARPGFTHTSLRVMEWPSPQLEQTLHLDSPALLILSNQEIEGGIVNYKCGSAYRFRDTIESKE